MSRILIFLFAMVLTTCGPHRNIVVPIERLSLFPDFTYAVISSNEITVPFNFHVACRVDGSGTYKVEALADPSCTSPDRGLQIGVFDPWSQTAQSVYDLGNGTYIRVVSISKRQLVGAAEPEAGDYILAGRIRQVTLNRRISEVFEKNLKIYRFEPTKVHYLGHVTNIPNSRLVLRDPDIVSPMIGKVSGMPTDRLILTPPKEVDVDCSGDNKQQTCRIK